MNRRYVRDLVFLTLISSASTASAVDRIGFDSPHVGKGWVCGAIGGGSRGHWSVERDQTAPSPPNVLKIESGRGSPWCVRKSNVLIDGFAEVSLKPVTGAHQQIAGLIWRWQSANSFYGAHLNLANNLLSVNYIENGKAVLLYQREMLAPIHAWRVMRVEFNGAKVNVKLDRKSILEFEDYRGVNAGAVGIWAAPEGVIAFDNFSSGMNQ